MSVVTNIVIISVIIILLIIVIIGLLVYLFRKKIFITRKFIPPLVPIVREVKKEEENIEDDEEDKEESPKDILPIITKDGRLGTKVDITRIKKAETKSKHGKIEPSTEELFDTKKYLGNRIDKTRWWNNKKK